MKMSAEELKLADELFDDAKYQDAVELLDKLSVCARHVA